MTHLVLNPVLQGSYCPLGWLGIVEAIDGEINS